MTPGAYRQRSDHNRWRESEPPPSRAVASLCCVRCACVKPDGIGTARGRDEMADLDPKPGKGDAKQPTTFEEFSSGADWRSLPLKIKLTVLKLLSAERDKPEKPRADD